MRIPDPIRVIAFDADDTLWDCQSHFLRVEQAYARVLAPWGTPEQVSAALFATESRNLGELGYGAKAFTLSLVENAVSMSEGSIGASDIGRILRLARELLHVPATPLPGVIECLQRLSNDGRWRLAVFTKGELQDQENKLRRSGLTDFFSHVAIVSDKTEQAFRHLCDDLRIAPSELMMVGNSLRSDIVPALAAGAWGVFIPFRHTWAHEETEPFDHPQKFEIHSMAELTAAIQPLLS